MLRSYHPAKFSKIWICLLKFKFSQILLGDKNATYLFSKIISTLLSDSRSKELKAFSVLFQQDWWKKAFEFLFLYLVALTWLTDLCIVNWIITKDDLTLLSDYCQYLGQLFCAKTYFVFARKTKQKKLKIKFFWRCPYFHHNDCCLKSSLCPSFKNKTCWN